MITKRQLKWMLIALAGVLILAFFTNPNQARHLSAIKETGLLRQSSSASISDILLPQIQYHNYLVFSTTTWADSTVTYGYFGMVQTTDNVDWLYGSGRAPK